MAPTTSYDLIIRGGTVVDGMGGQPYTADLAISVGRIAEVGKITGHAPEEIDAQGCIVTPGFVDVHTHYDGQVMWDNRMAPSSTNGVTSVVMGNCGVGFAPCRAEDRDRLVALMEGVEDVPGVVMAEGLPWNWETFPEYLDIVAQRSFDVDVVAQLPHSCLRVYVMGQRAVDGGIANAEDLRTMEALAREAVEAGAIGFATSRSVFHRDKNGTPIPSKDVHEAELRAIVAGMQAAGGGVIEALIDFDHLEDEFGLLSRLAEQTGELLTFTVSQIVHEPDAWKRALQLIAEANRDGLRIKGQVMARPMGMFVGLNVTFNPFSLHPSYQPIAGLPLAERVAILRTPEFRARILREKPGTGVYRRLDFLGLFGQMYKVDDPPRYDQSPDDSIAGIAARRGISPQEVAYDVMLEDDGQRLIHLRNANFVDGNMGVCRALLADQNTMLGLGDGGAHYGMICDAGYPSFMLTFWGRDCGDMGFTIPWIVKSLTWDNASAMGLLDRGRIEPGLKADLNVIDLDRLRVHRPHIVHDLPAGGARLLQRADGYVATIVSGEVTYRDGTSTGALPGRLVRGRRDGPSPVRASTPPQ